MTESITERNRYISKIFLQTSINYLQHSLEHLPQHKRIDIVLIASNLKDIHDDL